MFPFHIVTIQSRANTQSDFGKKIKIHFLKIKAKKNTDLKAFIVALPGTICAFLV